MQKNLLVFVFLLLSLKSFAQVKISGTILDSVTHIPVSGVTVIANTKTESTTSQEDGDFSFKSLAASIKSLTFTAIGYRQMTLPIANFQKNGTVVYLPQRSTQLADVMIAAGNTNPYKAISETDIKLRGISNAQEVLRIVPGLFIGQHQGGGKAEQIFLRGFYNDHGTDINMSVDDMPINMVSHAHGQGYAKLALRAR